MKILRFLLLILLLGTMLGASGGIAVAKSNTKNAKEIELLLKELDHYLNIRSSFESGKIDRITVLKQIAKSPNTTLEQRYSVYNSLIDEYTPYRFDSLIFYIQKNVDIAQTLNDKEKITESYIRQGLIYVTSGHYLEATDILIEKVDTTGMNLDLKVKYYTALQRYARELVEYAKDNDMMQDALKNQSYYRDILYDLIDHNSDQYYSLRIEELRGKKEYREAERLSLELIERTDPETHDYAMYAYIESLIREDNEDTDGQFKWLIKSATADIKNSIKDYGSLTTLSIMLFNMGDVVRAFRYIQICMEDALFYNAKLRPWQIALNLPVIEKAYNEKVEHQRQQVKTYSIIISVLVALLIAGAIFLINRTVKLNRAQKKLRELNTSVTASNQELETVNRKLSDLNKEVLEANAVKEEYIGLFLSILSENIEKLKNYENMVRKKIKFGKVDELAQELSRSNMIEEEMTAFYQTFDTAFITLYPHFVEEFNSLLDENGKIELKKGELLNTELRIFALIRLGIDDSSKIAALLRYSVNTIYNYRAKIKNNAIVSRDEFEERVKHIGFYA